MFCTVIFVTKYLFYPLDVPPFIEGSVKANKKEYYPFLFKWIHRELCDAWQRTGEITRWWKLETPLGL